MRIGINALYWVPNGMGGMQTYFLRLLEALLNAGSDHDFVVFLNREAASGFEVRSPRLTVDVCPTWGSQRMGRVAWENVRLGQRVSALRLDLLHSLGYLSPMRVGAKTVVTVPDLVHYLFPSDVEPAKRYLWKAMFPASLKRTDHIITISRRVRDELVEHFPATESKVTAVHLAVDRSVFHPGQAAAGERGRGDGIQTVLAVASMSRHKNLAVLLRAVAALRAQGTPLRLVLVGQPRGIQAQLEQLRQDLRLGSALEFTGHVSSDALVRHYREAAVMVFPSLYEGFGLPPLEAMACGCPVVASSASCIPEVVGDAAMLFDPTDADSLAAQLQRVLGSSALRADLVARGFRNLQRFSWEATATQTLAVYSRTLAEAGA